MNLHIKKYLILLVGIIILCSCEDFLTQNPTSEISEPELPKDSTSAVLLMNACYNGLHAALHTEWCVTEQRSDNARIYWALTSASSYTYIMESDIGQHSTINPFAEEYWDATYNNIYRCNYALEFIDNLSEEYASKETHRSEIRALRVNHYFNLVRNWGPVFLVKKPLLGFETRYTQRESVDKVYKFIEDELNDIIESESLPEKWDSVNLGRVNSLFPKSLLAKVYMTHYQSNSSEYAQAEELLKDVIDAIGNPPDYNSLISYDKIFSIENEMNDEIIFAVRYKAGNIGLGSTFGNDFAPSNSGSNVIYGQGRSYNYPTTSIINSFEEGDIRKDITLKERYFDNDKGVWIENPETEICRYVNKFLSPVSIKDDGENDFPVMRVGDVLLLYSEILNELGNTTGSLKYLNMIRQRAGLTPLSVADIHNNTHDLRVAIRKERRVELAFENQRFYDLMRWGIAKKTINKYFEDTPFYKKLRGGVVPHIDDWQLILPLPLSVLILNPEIPQNYGY